MRMYFGRPPSIGTCRWLCPTAGRRGAWAQTRCMSFAPLITMTERPSSGSIDGDETLIDTDCWFENVAIFRSVTYVRPIVALLSGRDSGGERGLYCPNVAVVSADHETLAVNGEGSIGSHCCRST